MVIVRMVRSTTQSISQVILIYLFVQFSKPDVMKTEEGDSDEEERCDMNLDMIYYMKNVPKMQRIKDVDYNVDIYKSAKQYLFEDESLKGSYKEKGFHVPIDAYNTEETQIDNFKNEMQKNWGKRESKLRTAIYVSFVKSTETNIIHENTKKLSETSYQLSTKITSADGLRLYSSDSPQ